MDNAEKLTAQTKKNKTKTQHNMCWTPLYVNKHKQRKQDITPPTNNWRYRRTKHRFYAEIVTDITTRNSKSI